MTASHGFFEQLDDRGYEPLLARTTGMLCVELVDGEQSDRYYISINKGAVSVSREAADVHCKVCIPMPLFDQVVQGEVNAMAAVLRGDMTVDGDPGILLLFQRLLPGPPNSSHPRARATTEQ